ncbi:SDR family oxidoreductase [Bradyrhizobium brasilense]|uniref:SDR family oxidoreductase n=1 Tax=Bradyrhizobium brasilense TaxID=1419277 RepID=UPI0014565064|nr:SDR family oxidoreductase [Bradyrhizobium brasilense]NLS75087.1 SDR family oxidoreductase [Bradyrhizobium brasilense]
MAAPEKAVLILGGASDIGRAIALALAQSQWTIRLAGRSVPDLQREADDISAYSGSLVTVHSFDVLDTASFIAFVDALPDLPDVVISAVGLLGEQHRAEIDLDQAKEVIRSNYEGPALILSVFAERFLRRGYGSIVGISSVAGDRGRGSNYFYGSAKAGFSAFLSGLRNRLAVNGAIQVMTVKPGFVRTKMTEHMKLPPLITASPEEVGEAVLSALNRRKDVIYARSIWFFVMLIIRLMPERIFKRLRL